MRRRDYAQKIARTALKRLRTPDGFVAGAHHFVDLWARDSLFATFGANVSGLSAASRATIESFLHRKRRDGLAPFLIRKSKLTVGKYFGHPEYLTHPRRQFRSSQSGGIVPDGGLMAIIAMRDYIGRAKDISVLKKEYTALKQAIDWYERKFRGNLIFEWFQCEWADAVLKTGSTLYTNVLYWKALGDMAHLARQHHQVADARTYADRQKRIGLLLRQQFWNGTFFADWRRFIRHDYFASHPNMLAIVFGLATNDEANSILAYAESHCWNGFTLETNYPKYPYWRIPLLNYLTGMADYHNRGCKWLQPGILFAYALWLQKRKTKARNVLDAIADIIARHQDVYEIYTGKGIPVARLLYTAEHPFAWSAGLFLWVADTVY